jgi:hypothetical protein
MPLSAAASAKRAKRRITMFSLISAIFSCTAWPTVCPGPNGCSRSAATSAGSFFQMCSAMPLTSAWKSGVFATKSVSQLTSTTTPLLPSAAMWAPTAPSEAARLAFLAAAASPFLRSTSRAFAMSPLVSTRAALQSIMPAPVSSRSWRTTSAVMLIVLPSGFE